MKLIVDWGERSDRIDELLKAGCSYCDSQLCRLVKHFAGNGFQVWLSCCDCAAKIKAPIPHSALKRWREYPQWRADMSEAEGRPVSGDFERLLSEKLLYSPFYRLRRSALATYSG